MNALDAQRILPVQGGFNFRDLGGICTNDGRTVKKHLLFRTDELSNLQPEDLDLLAGYHVQTIVDFRTDEERAKSVDRIPSSCKNEYHLNIIAANMESFMVEIESGKANYKKLLTDLYADLVLGDNAISEFGKFFQLLQQSDNMSFIYHCTAGKDRTGIATALILEALNVDWNTIESDYMLSNLFLKKKYETYIEQNPALTDLFLVHPAYLDSAFVAIKQKYGSVTTYLENTLQVDTSLMKKMYLL